MADARPRDDAAAPRSSEHAVCANEAREVATGRPRGVFGSGRAMVAVGTAPFAYAAVTSLGQAGGVGAPFVPCGFRALTGLPCPFCGATRAFRYAVAGDPAFLLYNPWWVFVAIALIVVGGVTMLRERSRRGRSTRDSPSRVTDHSPLWRRPAFAVAVVIAIGWCVGLAHRDAIVG